MSIVKSRIRGSFFGVLLGDCYGAIFEGESLAESGARRVLSNMFNRSEIEKAKGI